MMDLCSSKGKIGSQKYLFETKYEIINDDQPIEKDDSIDGATTRYYLINLKCKKYFPRLSHSKIRGNTPT